MRRSIFVCLGLLGCSGTAGDPAPAGESENPAPRAELVAHDYPFVSEGGEMVCAEWQWTDPETSESLMHRESYSFSIMNDLLSGRVPPETLGHDPAAVERVRASLQRVETCDDARRFTELRNGWERENPLESLSPPIREITPRGSLGGRALPAQAIERSDPRLDGNSELVIPRVADSVSWFAKYLVRLVTPTNTCTGFLIGPNTLITAAHCVPYVNGAFFAKVTYGAGRSCINPYCSTPEFPNVWGIRYPGWTGGDDWSRDFAVVFGFGNWLSPANDDTAWIRLLDQATANGEQFFIEGYGWTANEGGSSGTSRRSTFFEIIEENLGGQFRSTVTAGKGRACKGDSGGPAVNQGLIGKAPGFTPVAIGVAVGFSYFPFEPKCPDLGYTMFHSRVSNKLNWLDDRRAEFGLSACLRTTSNGNHYRRCFDRD
jgi:hypothetical protein